MRLTLLLLGTGLPLPLWAAGTAGEPDLLGSALKMAAALAVICGILLLLYAAGRKGFRILPRTKDGRIEVVETRPLGGRKFLCLVKVRDQELLLGISNDRIECLTHLPPQEDFNTTLEQFQEPQ